MDNITAIGGSRVDSKRPTQTKDRRLRAAGYFGSGLVSRNTTGDDDKVVQRALKMGDALLQLIDETEEK